MLVFDHGPDDQTIMPPLDDVLEMLGTKRPAPSDDMDSFQNGRFTGPVEPMEEIEPGAQVERSGIYIAEVLKFETAQPHGGSSEPQDERQSPVFATIHRRIGITT
jgi:hypothetical protein